jgi:inhibitor of KinA
LPSYQISPLGDSALFIDFGNKIDEDINKEVLARTNQLKQNLTGILEAVPAYSSITIYFDILKWRKKIPADKLVFDHLKEIIDQILSQSLKTDDEEERLVNIPVCYAPEFAIDVNSIAETNNITADEVIALHHSKTYRVYMLGFLPGFCYLGETVDKIAMPRKTKPIPVAPGAVGIAGKQTGIYPFASPGGWQIIGRTPLKLFNGSVEQPTLLKAGDKVQFVPISINDFLEIENSMADS